MVVDRQKRTVADREGSVVIDQEQMVSCIRRQCCNTGEYLEKECIISETREREELKWVVRKIDDG